MAKLPEVSTIQQLLRQGWTFASIANHYGVQEMTVWRKLQRAGIVGNKKTYRDYLPWSVLDEHRDAEVFRSLKSLYLLDDGEELSEKDQMRAYNLRKRLERANAVVGYHPKFPPNGASQIGGFYYASRQGDDGKYHAVR